MFSIILPTHNRAGVLPRAIRSMLTQTYRKWELIIIDDGSTDNTRQIVGEFQEDPRIRYHYQENRQLNGARNSGVQLAGGEYLGFLDDDDEFLPNHLSVLAALIAADNGQHDIYRSGEIMQRGAKQTKGHNYQNGKDILPQYWEHVTGMFGMLIARKIMEQNPFDAAHLLLDDFLWLNQVLLTASLRQSPTYTAIVHLHPGQRSAGYLTDELLAQNISRLAAAYNLPGVPERVPFSAYQFQIFHQYLHYSRQLGRAGKRVQAIKMWRRGLAYATTDNARELARTLLLCLTGR